MYFSCITKIHDGENITFIWKKTSEWTCTAYDCTFSGNIRWGQVTDVLLFTFSCFLRSWCLWRKCCSFSCCFNSWCLSNKFFSSMSHIVPSRSDQENRWEQGLLDVWLEFTLTSDTSFLPRINWFLLLRQVLSISAVSFLLLEIIFFCEVSRWFFCAAKNFSS